MATRLPRQCCHLAAFDLKAGAAGGRALAVFPRLGFWGAQSSPSDVSFDPGMYLAPSMRSAVGVTVKDRGSPPCPVGGPEGGASVLSDRDSRRHVTVWAAIQDAGGRAFGEGLSS